MRALILLVPLIMGGNDPGSGPPHPRNAPAAEQDSVVHARVGEEFTLVLQSNATTGYRWMLADSLDESLLRLVDQRYVPDPNPEQRVGAGGREAWVFAAVAPGEAGIRLRYARAAGGPAPRSAAFRVVIGAAQ